jgi:ABC-2 type transport system permease protein
MSVQAAASPAGAERAFRVPLRAYTSMARMALRSLVAYRVSMVFNLLASAFAALAMLYLWHAVLTNERSAAGFNWPHMKAYLLITFIASSLVSGYTDSRMAARIRQGDVAMDLVRPVDYQRSRFAEACGSGVYEAGMAIAVAACAAVAFGGVPAPPAQAWGLFLLSALLVFPLRFAVVYASGLLTFWTSNYVGVQTARVALVTFLSGAFVPLAFLPGWLRSAVNVLPFVGMASTPALIYVGHLAGKAAVSAVAVQAGWSAGLWMLARALWWRASRQLTVHGG